MKRLHVHLAVADLEANIRFYSGLFGVAPTVRKDDYAKWMLDDPRVNFAISNRSDKRGLDHLGIQVEDESELGELKTRLERAEAPIEEQTGTACCYMRSDKYWTLDPQGVPWETFHSLEAIPTFNEAPAESQSACCAPQPAKKNACC
ncbi:VOC family protein [Ectothiorhodospiraceae bacterium 2226]|nr:VOC family protein [Ectothiorhodospiraceae bacterium 2226]